MLDLRGESKRRIEPPRDSVGDQYAQAQFAAALARGKTLGLGDQARPTPVA